MPLTTPQLIAAAVTFLLASIVQSAVGFGMGLISIPILVWFDIPLVYAIAMTMSASFVSTAQASITLRKEIPWREALGATVLRGIGTLAGIYLLTLLANTKVSTVKQVLGVVILAVVALKWFFKPTPRERIGLGWSVVAFLTSGVMGGAFGMGGPPMVLWVIAHSWSTYKMRAFLMACMMLIYPLTVALFRWRFGPGVMPAVGVGLAMVVVLLGGNFIGLRIGARLSRTLLVRVAITMLTILAVSSLVSPWL